MRFLSQATVPYATALRARLADGYAWHGTIWESFPGRPDAERDFLFRVDRRTGGFRLLLLSTVKPTATETLVWRTKEVASSFLDHAAYRFRVKANPTMRRSADKRRLALYDETRLREWLIRKAAAGGFELDAATLEVGTPLDETFVKGGRRGKHVSVDFAGVLRVIDRACFIQTFHSGIGAAKGFGYGLLMLQPIH